MSFHIRDLFTCWVSSRSASLKTDENRSKFLQVLIRTLELGFHSLNRLKTTLISRTLYFVPNTLWSTQKTGFLWNNVYITLESFQNLLNFLRLVVYFNFKDCCWIILQLTNLTFGNHTFSNTNHFLIESKKIYKLDSCLLSALFFEWSSASRYKDKYPPTSGQKTQKHASLMSSFLSWT